MSRVPTHQPTGANLPSEAQVFTRSPYAEVTDITHRVSQLSMEAARLVKLLPDGFIRNDYTLSVVLKNMEELLWTHSNCDGLCNIVHRLLEEANRAVHIAQGKSEPNRDQTL